MPGTPYLLQYLASTFFFRKNRLYDKSFTYDKPRQRPHPHPHPQQPPPSPPPQQQPMVHYCGISFIAYYGWVHSNEDLIMCKNWGIYEVLGPSWVLITYNICPPAIVQSTHRLGVVMDLALRRLGVEERWRVRLGRATISAAACRRPLLRLGIHIHSRTLARRQHDITADKTVALSCEHAAHKRLSAFRVHTSYTRDIYSLPFIYLSRSPSTPAPSLVVPQIRVTKAGSSPSSPLGCVPRIMIARRVQRFLPPQYLYHVCIISYAPGKLPGRHDKESRWIETKNTFRTVPPVSNTTEQLGIRAGSYFYSNKSVNLFTTYHY